MFPLYRVHNDRYSMRLVGLLGMQATETIVHFQGGGTRVLDAAVCHLVHERPNVAARFIMHSVSCMMSPYCS
jgi:hypothetical protein